ncbi:hypothetical protein LIA77_01634 [Sarocladium implicatum]|nr:hypothetical protein LIA77_01634 [Sarocladium implicatum]
MTTERCTSGAKPAQRTVEGSDTSKTRAPSKSVRCQKASAGGALSGPTFSKFPMATVLMSGVQVMLSNSQSIRMIPSHISNPTLHEIVASQRQVCRQDPVVKIGMKEV